MAGDASLLPAISGSTLGVSSVKQLEYSLIGPFVHRYTTNSTVVDNVLW